MKKAKKILVAGTLTFGIGTGVFLSTPQGIDAASNVVLASVDWVTSQLKPINSKITNLEKQVANQQKEIDLLKAQLSQNNPTPPPSNEEPGEIPNTVYISKSAATIHSGATKDYKTIATRTKGSSLKVIDSFNSASGLWYRVELSSDQKGWIHSGDVSTTKVAADTINTVTTTQYTNLRKGATSGYASYQGIAKGTQLKYISTFINGSGETWYNVETSSGKRGWVISTHSEVR